MTPGYDRLAAALGVAPEIGTTAILIRAALAWPEVAELLTTRPLYSRKDRAQAIAAIAAMLPPEEEVLL